MINSVLLMTRNAFVTDGFADECGSRVVRFGWRAEHWGLWQQQCQCDRLRGRATQGAGGSGPHDQRSGVQDRGPQEERRDHHGPHRQGM